MARPTNPNSVRQRAFKLLDTMTDVKFEEVVRTLKEKFSIGDSYATSLWAAHRRMNRENGNMVKVYSVRDTKNGKPVEPYIKVENVFHPPADACLSIKQAKEQYERMQKDKIKQAKRL